MLYGHEVEKPQWYKWERKARRCRRLGKPAIKREAVFTRLRLGWTVEQIALNLEMSKRGVQWCIWMICKQERVKSRHEVAAKLGIGSYHRHVFLCAGDKCCTSEVGLAAWGQLRKGPEDPGLRTASPFAALVRLAARGELDPAVLEDYRFLQRASLRLRLLRERPEDRYQEGC